MHSRGRTDKRVAFKCGYLKSALLPLFGLVKLSFGIHNAFVVAVKSHDHLF
jgi:hypothetical protein